MKNVERKIIGFLVTLFICIAVFQMPLVHASTESEEKNIRVGYVNSPFFSEGTKDGDTKSGYAYEYLQRLSAYGGWSYEYIYGGWSDIFAMLQNGEVDVVAGIAYSPDREEYISFPKYSMGIENYYIYCYESQPFANGNLDKMAGSVIGCTKDSMQNHYLELWNEQTGGICEIETFDSNEALYQAFEAGEIHAVVDTDNTITQNKELVPIKKIGESEYYLAVTKNRPDLLEEINSVLEEIDMTDPYWAERLHHKYFTEIWKMTNFSNEDRIWLQEHPVIRIGYEKEFLAFCGYNEKTGEMEGALKTFIEQAEKQFGKQGVAFEVIPYDNVGAALAGLEKEEVDVVFPIYQSLSEAEKEKVLITNGLASTAMTAIIKSKDFSEFEENTVAVVSGFVDIEWYVKENYPNWKVVTYPTFKDCFQAVKEGKADCVIESTYVYKYFLEDNSFETISLSKSAEVSFIMKQENRQLYSILNQIIAGTSNTAVIATMAQYSNPKRENTFMDYVKDNVKKVLIVAFLIFILMTILLFRTMSSEMKAKVSKRESEELLSHLNKKQVELEEALHRAYFDGLTGLYNRYYCNEIEKKLDTSEEYENMTMIVIDVNGLKQANDTFGHETGDEIIVGVARLLVDSFPKDLCFRTGGDEYMVISKSDDVIEEVSRFMEEVKKWKNNKVSELSVSVGVASRKDYPGMSFMKLSALADQKMYEAKRAYYTQSGFDRRKRREA